MAGREHELTPDLILRAYANGIFPMAETRDDPDIFWVDPELRGVLPLDGFHVSRSLMRRLKSEPFQISFDMDFAGVVRGCAARQETWISERIEALYHQLHTLGFAHSIEVWEDNQLVGGVYGVTLGSAFFGESMFSTRTDASKVALAYLTAHLKRCGFQLFDTQFLTDHLASLGAVEIPRDRYHALLGNALGHRAVFKSGENELSVQDVTQRSSQTS